MTFPPSCRANCLVSLLKISQWVSSFFSGTSWIRLFLSNFIAPTLLPHTQQMLQTHQAHTSTALCQCQAAAHLHVHACAGHLSYVPSPFRRHSVGFQASPVPGTTPTLPIHPCVGSAVGHSSALTAALSSGLSVPPVFLSVVPEPVSQWVTWCLTK